MRRNTMILFTVPLAASFMFTLGCVSRTKEVRTEQTTPVVERQVIVPVVERQVIVQPPAPPPRVEVRPAAPAVGYVWVPGIWQWNGRDYEWVPGYWRAQ